MSGRSQEVIEDDNDSASITIQQQDIKSPLSPCPQRSAAVKASTEIAEWNKILGGLEGVVH